MGVLFHNIENTAFYNIPKSLSYIIGKGDPFCLTIAPPFEERVVPTNNTTISTIAFVTGESSCPFGLKPPS